MNMVEVLGDSQSRVTWEEDPKVFYCRLARGQMEKGLGLDCAAEIHG